MSSPEPAINPEATAGGLMRGTSVSEPETRKEEG